MYTSIHRFLCAAVIGDTIKERLCISGTSVASESMLFLRVFHICNVHVNVDIKRK